MTTSTTPKNQTQKHSTLELLEEVMASTCFCKLREGCDDKNGIECLKDRNLYAEAMLSRDTEH